MKLYFIRKESFWALFLFINKLSRFSGILQKPFHNRKIVNNHFVTLYSFLRLFNEMTNFKAISILWIVGDIL